LKFFILATEIKYQGQQVAQINKDKGIDNMEIDIYSQYIHPDSLHRIKISPQ
jgi:hypothetical protein